MLGARAAPARVSRDEVRDLLVTRVIMSRLTQLGVCAIATLWLGCGLDDGTMQSAGTAQGGQDEIPDEATDEGLAKSPLGSRILLSFHRTDGSAALGGFTSKDEVHLRTRLAPGSAPFGGGEFAFVVVDPDGRRLSMDALDCRRLHIAPGAGGIAEVHVGIDITGVPCQHAWNVYGDGWLIPELVAFADAPPSTQGVMEYTVLVAPVDKIARGPLPQDGVFPEDSYRATFTIRPEQ